MSADPTTRESRLRENSAEADLAMLRNQIEAHLSSVGKTPDLLLARSSAGVRNVEKIIKELKEIADGRDDLDLKSLVRELDIEFRPIKNRIAWHDTQIEAFKVLRKTFGSGSDDVDPE